MQHTGGSKKARRRLNPGIQHSSTPGCSTLASSCLCHSSHFVFLVLVLLSPLLGCQHNQSDRRWWGLIIEAAHRTTPPRLMTKFDDLLTMLFSVSYKRQWDPAG